MLSVVWRLLPVLVAAAPCLCLDTVPGPGVALAFGGSAHPILPVVQVTAAIEEYLRRHLKSWPGRRQTSSNSSTSTSTSVSASTGNSSTGTGNSSISDNSTIASTTASTGTGTGTGTGNSTTASTDITGNSSTSTITSTRARTNITNKTIFAPSASAGYTGPLTLYARAVALSTGDLLATWENYSPEPPSVYFPIYRSTDKGASWTELSRVKDTVNGWGLRYQPFLYELPVAIGDFPAGTVLAAGNSIPTDLSKTKIDVYASTDAGRTWAFVSSVASGGEAQATNGLTPVWEPSLLVHDGTLICYYSDQRDSKFAQKLVHQTTTDLRTWAAAVDDMHDASDYESRPGMSMLALLPDGNYIFSYELCGTDGCQVHYRLTPDPLNVMAETDRAYRLTSTKGSTPVSAPYVTWSSVGGANGTILLNAASGDQMYANRHLGDPDAWVEVTTAQPSGYSRALVPLPGPDGELLIISGGPGVPGAQNHVSCTVMDLGSALGV